MAARGGGWRREGGRRLSCGRPGLDPCEKKQLCVFGGRDERGASPRLHAARSSLSLGRAVKDTGRCKGCVKRIPRIHTASCVATN